MNFATWVFWCTTLTVALQLIGWFVVRSRSLWDRRRRKALVPNHELSLAEAERNLSEAEAAAGIGITHWPIVSKEHELRRAYNRRNGIGTSPIATVTRRVSAVWMLRRLQTMFPQLAQMTIIEIGAGTGCFAVELAPLCKHVFAIEGDPMFNYDFCQQLYKKKPPNLTWLFDVAKPEMAASNGGWLPRADLVLVLTGSDEENLRTMAQHFGGHVVMPWQDWRQGHALVDWGAEEDPPATEGVVVNVKPQWEKVEMWDGARSEGAILIAPKRDD